MLYRFSHKFGRAPYRQAVCLCLPGQANVLHADIAVKPGCDAKDHTAGLHRFFIENMHIVSVKELQPKGHSARRAADSAGKVYKQRMLIVYFDLVLFQLLSEAQCRHGVSQEQID